MMGDEQAPPSSINDTVLSDYGGPVGHRLLPSVLDALADKEPEKVYAYLPRSQAVSDGFEQVTMKQMARGVNFLSCELYRCLGDADGFPTLAFTCDFDIRFAMMILAAAKNRRKLLVLSTRNTMQHNLHLLTQSECVDLFYGEEISSLAIALARSHPGLSIYAIGPYQRLLDQPSSHFTFESSFTSCRSDPLVLLHSSGSTGSPKLTKWTHEAFSVVDRYRFVPTPPGRRLQNASMFKDIRGGRFYSSFPGFHLAGITATLLVPLFYGSAVITSPTGVSGNGVFVSDLLSQMDLGALYVPPTILEQFMECRGALEKARKLNFILYGGGPLNPNTGSLLTRACSVCQVYGSTEIGGIQQLVPLKEDWNYFEFNPYETIDMQLIIEDGFELVLRSDESNNHHKVLHYTYPDISEWRTGDLFRRHPSKPGLWKFYLRTDDLVVLGNGYKLNPSLLETRILEHPQVSAALVVGTNKPCIAIILEVLSDLQEESCARLRNDLWGILDEANASYPEYGRILPGMILMAQKEKPFLRSPKGVIMRRATCERYEVEIEALYSGTGLQSNVIGTKTLRSRLTSSFEEYLRSFLHILIPGKIDLYCDLFTIGLDSLKAAAFTVHILRGLSELSPKASRDLTTTFVYRHRTIASLVVAMEARLTCSEMSPKSPSPSVDTLVEKYSLISQSMNSSHSQLHILITGTTGAIGEEMLKLLAQNPTVSEIYCLNRSPAAPEKAQRVLTSINKGLTKAIFFVIDLSKPRLGLENSAWERITSCVNIVVHGAWQADYNLPLESFEDHIRGLQGFLSLCASSRSNPRLVFLSSVGALSEWNLESATAVIPEIVPRSRTVAGTNGYSQSKLAAEQILALATERGQVLSSILRLTQLTPSSSVDPELQWSENNWFFIMVKTSQSLGLIPTGNLSIDWLGTDTAARIACEIIVRSHQERPNARSSFSSEVYNICSPYRMSWARLVKVLQKRLGPNAKVVTFDEWLQVLHVCRSNNMQEIAAKPALKIIPFFERLAAKARKVEVPLPLETAHAAEASTTMARLTPLEDDQLERWINHCNI